jgi:hypothetical protein
MIIGLDALWLLKWLLSTIDFLFFSMLLPSSRNEMNPTELNPPAGAPGTAPPSAVSFILDFMKLEV